MQLISKFSEALIRLFSMFESLEFNMTYPNTFGWIKNLGNFKKNIPGDFVAKVNTKEK